MMNCSDDGNDVEVSRRPLLEMTDLSQGRKEDDSEEEEEEAKKVPPFMSHIKMIQYWCGQFRTPLLVLVGNIVCFVVVDVMLSQVFQRRQYYMLDWSSTVEDCTEPSEKASLFPRVRFDLTAGLVVKGMIFVLDAYLCGRGIQFLERKIAEKSREESEAFPSLGDRRCRMDANTNVTDSVQDKPFDILELSRTVDSLFGCARTPNASSSTFLVELMAALFSLSVWGVTAASSSIICLQMEPCMKGKFSCFLNGPYDMFYDSGFVDENTISSLQNERNFDHLPLAIQSWVKGKKDNLMTPMSVSETPIYEQDSPTLPYVQVTDGSLAFSYTSRINETSTKNGVAVHPPTEGSQVIVYSSDFSAFDSDDLVDSDRPFFDLVGIPSTKPYTGWCGVAATKTPTIIFPEVICYREGNTTHRFSAVVDEDTQELSSWSQPTSNYFVTDDCLWVANRRQYSRLLPNKKQEEEKAHLSITSYNISTMERKLEIEKITTKKRDNFDLRSTVVKPSCQSWHSTIVWSSLVVLLLLSAFLYWRDTSSCTVPGSICLSLLSGYLLSGLWSSATILFAAWMCSGLMISNQTEIVLKKNHALWKFISFDMLVWAQYTVLGWLVFSVLHSSWRYFSVRYLFLYFGAGDVFFLLLFFVPVVINVLVLNHPVLEMLGIILGIFSIANLFFNGSSTVLISFVLLILSLGFCAMGNICRQCHWQTKTYFRRGLRVLKSTYRKR